MHWKVLKEKMLLLLSTCPNGIPEDQIGGMKECVEAGEEEIAFDSICSQIDEYDLTVTSSYLMNIKELGEAMKMDSSLWESLKVVD